MDDGPSALYFWIALAACTLVYPLMVLSSVAITRSRGKYVRELAHEGAVGARYARVVLSKANSCLLSLQIGSYLCAFVAGLIFVALWPYAESGVRSEIVHFLEVLCAVLGSWMLAQFSKAIAFASPEKVLCRSAAVVLLLNRLLSPFVYVLEQLMGKVFGRFGIRIPIERELVVSAEEISEMVELSSEAGEIEEDEREMIQGVFEFSDTVVREVMTPRKDIVSVEESSSLEQITKLFVDERLSRILVTGSELDDVRGILLAKDFMGLVGHTTPRFDIKRFMRPAYFVSDSKRVDALLEEFKRDAVHFAVVLDEHGGVDGVVTVEDLIEEIVGEIFDEHDSPSDETPVVKTKSGDLLVDGSMLIDDLNDNHNLAVPQGEYDTIAGYLIHQAGRIPSAGEEYAFDGMKVIVEEVDQNRVTRVRLQLPKKSSSVEGLPAQSFETSRSPGESNLKSPENLKRANASGR